MTPEEMEQVRPRLEEFAAGMFGGLARSDQRAKGELYVRGLLLDGKRKSMQPMAARLGVDHQQLQQFVSSSTWDYAEVRGRLARWAQAFISPRAFVVDDTGYPKDGVASPGVARMYSGSLGKVGNCQIGVSVHAVTDWASAAIDWRLFLPKTWDDTVAEHAADPETRAQIRVRRARSRIPDDVRHAEKWRQALEMLDEITGPAEVDGEPADGWGLDRLPVVADAGYGDAAEFRLGLEARGFSYVVAVKATTSAYPADAEPVTPPYSGRGRPPEAAYPEGPSTLAALALQEGRGALRRVTWRHGSRKTTGNPTAAMTGRFLALRVRPANRNIPRAPDGSLPECWLIAEWPPGEPEPTDYWLSNLPPETPLREMVGLAKIRWRIEHDYRELKDGLGLDHFEGRSYLGWHRHVTLTALAQAFCTSLRYDPKAPAPA
ncbi:IS701 family transposase [Pseudonocardia adelaidensis]|uniref:IS701-like element ISBj9 family transposase n=1 Tax=Pseudonocardia adelaidensis TaxID=648754 RepID=A0ABP9PDU0_9PSEU